MIELDGSLGEGGGQILRTSLALSLITKQPFRLRNIRARRAKPGLQPQHLMSVEAARTIGQGQVRGGGLGSTDLTFEPGEVFAGKYHFRIGTAGATGLVLHTVYLPLALADGPSIVTIEGGTHVKASPCFHFLASTWCGYMKLLGVDVEVRMHRPGFFPRGGGLIEARIARGAALTGLDLPSLGRVSRICGHSVVAGLPASIAERQANQVRARLGTRPLSLEMREESWPRGPGTVVVLEANTQPVPTSFFGLGERGKPAEKVADEAVEQLEAYLQIDPTGLDSHSADQVLLPLALAKTPSRFRVAEITQHLLTNAKVIERFIKTEVEINGSLGDSGEIRITGEH